MTLDYSVQILADLYARAAEIDKTKGKVVFWIPGGHHIMLRVEGAIAAALRFRGIEVHAVICNAPFRACVQREIDHNRPISEWAKQCISCQKYNTGQLYTLGVEHSFIGDYVPEDERAEMWARAEKCNWDNLEELNDDGNDLAKNIRSAMVRFLKGWPIDGYHQVLSEFVYSGLIVRAAAKCCLDLIQPSRIFMSHGIYIDWGPMLQEALGRGIPISVWMNSYLPGFFYFNSLKDPKNIDFHGLSEAAWMNRSNTPLTEVEEERLDNYLVARYSEAISIDIKEFPAQRKNRAQLCRELGLREDRPIWAVMSHINWDAVCDYAEMAFPSFDDWIVETVKEVSKIPEVQWLIKIHPAEASNNPDSGIEALIRARFASLPDNIKVVTANAKINPLDFYELIDGATTVYGTSGLEVLMFGKPLILAGKAHYSNRGLTYDGLSRETYLALLSRVQELPKLTDEQLAVVRRMTYCHFLQRQVPLPFISFDRETWWSFETDRQELLMPGASDLVEFVCDCIMEGKDFIMDETLVTQARKVLENSRAIK